MEIKKEDLTPEQIAQLEKLYKKYMLKLFIAGFLYTAFSFFGNLAIIIVDELYLHNPQFRFFGIVGTVLITFTGMRGTTNEYRDILVEEVKKIVGHDQSRT